MRPLKILGESKILIPRRSPEERSKNYLIIAQKKIQQYIKDGGEGGLDLNNTSITSLPDNLKVGGYLDLVDTKITSLPNNLKVGGSLYLNSTPITSLPDNLKVGGDLDLFDTPLSSKTEAEIRQMAPGIKGRIFGLKPISESKILTTRRSPEERSKNYQTALQKKIQQYIKDGGEGDLDLSYTPITSLPNNLKVGGSLDLYNTPITSLPDNLKVGGYLSLTGTKITSLPDNLKVGGGLYLGDTPITSLPDNLKVGGRLNLTGTKITSLPDNLKVGGGLYLGGTPLSSKTEAEIRQMAPGIKGAIYGFKPISESKILTTRRSPEERSKNYQIAIQKRIQQYIKDGGEGDLDLNNTPITSLPDNLKVGGYLNLANTPITSLPNNLKVRSGIDLEETPITSLPNNLEVGGYLNLANTPITSLPNNLKVRSSLYLGGTPLSSKTEAEIRQMAPGIKGRIIGLKN